LKEEGETKKKAENLGAKSMPHFHPSYRLGKREPEQAMTITLEAKAGNTQPSLPLF
jgi:hypothetical protein